MPPQLVRSDEALDQVSCDALLVGAVTGDQSGSLVDDRIDGMLDGLLSEHLRDVGFKAKIGDLTIVPIQQRISAKSVAVVGLGGSSDLDATALRRAAGVAGRRLSDRGVVATNIHEAISGGGGAGAVGEGLLLGCYRFVAYKSDPKPAKLERILMLGNPDAEELDRATAIAEATWLARDLTNEPASTLTPELLASMATEMAATSGLECTVYDENALGERGFGGILGVNQGSNKPPRLIQLRYAPASPKGKVVLVGKGITFDSGGLSLKDAKNMETMKTDMAGAAAVIGAMSALARLGVGVEVLALVPATENMPGGNAIKPGDVIKHYGGRTSEVLNTDAEGRLVLADAVAFACEQEPDAIIDVATLTGAIMVALGKKATGLFCNDDGLRDEIAVAAARAGERVWPMPLYDDYRTDLDSEIADIKNTGPRWGGAINGALFIRDFLKDGVPWAHLDIAGPSRADGDYDENVKGGTGVGTRTLLAFLEGRSR
ncbi:MAG: leucyl aminopeptidase [Actinomycetota bacterium]